MKKALTAFLSSYLALFVACSVLGIPTFRDAQEQATSSSTPTATAPSTTPASPTPTPSGSASPSTTPSGPVSQVPVGKGVAPDRGLDPIPDVRPPGVVDPPPGKGMDRYLAQIVTWKPCGDARCAEVLAPLDWENPDGVALTLSLKMVKAEKPNDALPPLMTNPGGPGASAIEGLDALRGYAPPGYNLLAMDSRGTGHSTPVVCGGREAWAAYRALDISPDSDAEWTSYIEGSRAYFKTCLDKSGALLQHITTADAARDMNLVRQLMGEETIAFVGYSYGVELGSTYAAMGFPYSRMVLDAPPGLPTGEPRERWQPSYAKDMASFDDALADFGTWCVEQASCKLGRTQRAVVEAVGGLLQRLDTKPLTVGTRHLTQTDAAYAISSALYSEDERWHLLGAVVDGIDGDGKKLLEMADEYWRDGNGSDQDAMTRANIAIRCGEDGDVGVADARRAFGDIAKAGPHLTQYTVGLVECEVWPVQPRIPPRLTFAAGKPPVQIIGGTEDPVTPFEAAQELHDAMPGSGLLTVETQGHTSFGTGRACVDRAVLQYFRTGKPVVKTCRES